MDAPTDPRPATDAPSGDGAPVPAVGQTLDMSQVAGERPTALPANADKPKKDKDKKKALPMADAGSSKGALPSADQNLVDLGTKRGIETLFRSSYRVNMDLSALADAKANIMISINGLIVSILIASIAPGIENNTWLLLPTSLFLIGCLTSLVYAVFAARPRVQSNVVTKESALENRTNILFFGNFHHMPQTDYVEAMKEVVQDPTQIYEMMIKDIYGVGSVLQKKYLLLRRSYTTFIIALVVGVISFIGVFTYAATMDPDPDTVYTIPAQTPPPGQTGPATGPSGILP